MWVRTRRSRRVRGDDEIFLLVGIVLSAAFMRLLLVRQGRSPVNRADNCRWFWKNGLVCLLNPA